MDISPRTIRFCAGGMLAVLMLTAAGCQPWQIRTAVGDAPPSSATLDAVRDQLRFDRWRANASWSVLEPIREREPRATASVGFRWTFDSDSFGDSLDRIGESPAASDNANAEQRRADGDQEIEDRDAGSVAKPAAAEEQASADSRKSADVSNQNWPRRLEELLDAVDSRWDPAQSSRGASDANAHLRTLAGRDDLAGWNAAILLARRDPAGATPMLPVLARLVSQPPRYDSETKTAAPAADDAAKPIATKPTGLRSLWEKPADEGEAQAAKTKPQGQPISVSMRAAAAEAWCLVLAHATAEKADALGPAGRLLEDGDLPIEVGGELFRGVGRWVSPEVIPRLEEALREPRGSGQAPIEVRRAAIEACALHALESRLAGGGTGEREQPAFDAAAWPSTVWACQFDPDAHVRRVFGRWVALVHHPDALGLLRTQLSDAEPGVREAALVSLGTLETVEALGELKRQAARPEERVRAFAVQGLAAWGVREIAPHAADASHAVRKTVVEELGRMAEPEAALALRDLLLDSNPQVQESVVGAIAQWPDSLAVPLLLFGMQDSGRATRQECFVALRRRTGLQEAFPFEGTPAERADAVKQIASKYDLSSGFVNELRQTGLQTVKVEAVHASEIEAALESLAQSEPGSEAHRAALERLSRFSAADLPVVERYLRRAPAAGMEAVYREVLPAWSPIYRALLDLESNDVLVRRRASERISQGAAAASLSAAAVRRLGASLVHEQDELVWRYAMAAVMQDGDDESAYIALLAVNHAWPDIRILGCAYAARHGSAQHAAALIPLLSDPNKRVQLAAIEAAGRCRNPVVLDDRVGEGARPMRGLRSLLTHADRDVRFASAVAMSRLGDPHAMQEIVRLCADPNATVREQAVREMGATGQTRFVEYLIRLAWTEQSNQVKRAILESLDQLVPSDSRPVGLAGETSYDTRIERWVEWWEKEKSGKRTT